MLDRHDRRHPGGRMFILPAFTSSLQKSETLQQQNDQTAKIFDHLCVAINLVRNHQIPVSVYAVVTALCFTGTVRSTFLHYIYSIINNFIKFHFDFICLWTPRHEKLQICLPNTCAYKLTYTKCIVKSVVHRSILVCNVW